jgi:hypothetical protein
MTERKMTKGQTTIYKTLHSKLKIEQQKPYYKSRVNSNGSDGYAVTASLVAHVVLLLLQTQW